MNAPAVEGNIIFIHSLVSLDHYTYYVRNTKTAIQRYIAQRQYVRCNQNHLDFLLENTCHYLASQTCEDNA